VGLRLLFETRLQELEGYTSYTMVVLQKRFRTLTSFAYCL
jgi:hypothetical protein